MTFDVFSLDSYFDSPVSAKFFTNGELLRFNAKPERSTVSFIKHKKAPTTVEARSDVYHKKLKSRTEMLLEGENRCLFN